MSGPIGAAVLVLVGYLLGAMPVGVLVGRLAGGIDLRRHGSRRTGSTNAMRTLGLGWALAVLLLDIAKGTGAVLLVLWLFESAGGDWVAAAAGGAAVLGHTRSVFIGFGGGRGVATSGGALVAMAPVGVAILLPVMAAVIWRTRYVSLGSLTGALAAPAVTAALLPVGLATPGAVALALAVAVIVTWSHGDNIARLRAGTERRFGEKETTSNDAPG